jgi:hypothetical protein
VFLKRKWGLAKFWGSCVPCGGLDLEVEMCSVWSAYVVRRCRTAVVQVGEDTRELQNDGEKRLKEEGEKVKGEKRVKTSVVEELLFLPLNASRPGEQTC